MYFVYKFILRKNSCNSSEIFGRCSRPYSDKTNSFFGIVSIERCHLLFGKYDRVFGANDHYDFCFDIFGLMIDAERLVAIRSERKANSRYASFNQCQMELRAVEGIYISEGIKYLNVSEMSIEEISTRVLQMTGLKRRIG